MNEACRGGKQARENAVQFFWELSSYAFRVNLLMSHCCCCEKHRRIRCLLLDVFSEWEHFHLWTPHLVSRPVVCFSKYSDDESNSLPLFVFKLQMIVSFILVGWTYVVEILLELNYWYTCSSNNSCLSRNSSVGIATCYELDGPGIESRWGTRFPTRFHIGPGAHTASLQWASNLLPVGYRGQGVALTTHLYLAPCAQKE
jgi:hypothetical protein